MLGPRYRWRLPRRVTPAPDLAAAGRAAGLSTRVVDLLVRRGIADADELRAFLGEAIVGLHDPGRLPDAEAVRARIARARSTGERVLVFGDFDADGLTGLAVLTLALRRLGLDATPYVPSRLDEGHGLSRRAIEAAVDEGRTLIVTVDCGSTSGPEIVAATGRGVDVIVTDHHRLPPTLPPAIAVVNPHRADAGYPDPRLSGSGVAFKVAQLLLEDEPGGAAAALDLADLATIGTVADVAPVVGENRAIARLGLERLRTAPRPGLAALLAAMKVRPEIVDLETIAFGIAPRLNAAGRVGEARDAAELLLAEDAPTAESLAARLEAANGERRTLTAAALAEAIATAAVPPEDPPPAILVRGPWAVGVIGLVAARLAESHNRPAVVVADLGAVLRGSCRGVDGVDVGAAVDACGELLIRHGGHAGAAGFEMAADRWEAFVERFGATVAAAGERDPRPVLALDLALPATAVDYALLRELASLAPTGPGNPDPLLAVVGLTVTRVRTANGGHTQLTLRREVDVLDAIAFGRDDLPALLAEGDRVDIVARVASRAFGGFESLQLEIRDIAPAGTVAALAAGRDPGQLAAAGPPVPSLGGTA